MSPVASKTLKKSALNTIKNNLEKDFLLEEINDFKGFFVSNQKIDYDKFIKIDSIFVEEKEYFILQKK